MKSKLKSRLKTMNKELIKEFIEKNFSYMIFFYISLFLIVWPFLNNNQTIETAKLRTLNRLMPPLSQFVINDIKGQSLAALQLDKYLFYYDKVSDYLPKNADAYFMKGYCYTQTGLFDKAQKNFQQAIDLNPHFFWGYYNLGIVHLKLGQWDAAIESFQKALNTKPEITIKILLTSKVFQQLLVQLDQPGKILPINLKTAYKDCYQLILLSNTLKKATEKQIPPQINNQLQVKMF